MPWPGRLGSRLPAVLAAFAAGLMLVSCTEHDPAEAVEADGAETVAIPVDDGAVLDGRLWDRGTDRVVVYLHEFREDQNAWWPTATETAAVGISALTFDFRGHGASEGEHDDVGGMVRDTTAAVVFLRERGFERVMLVGAGMGAAVALVAAADVPDITVAGLSAPADFDTLDAVAAVEHLDGRVQLIATRDDVSAADSLHKFRSLGNIDSTEARLYPGGAHGVDLLSDGGGPSIRERFDELLNEFWVPRQS